jgi:acetyl esterase/lipase
MIFRSFLTLFLSLCLSGCTRLSLAAVNAPTYLSGATVMRDLFFGSQPSQKLDIYMPKARESKPHDVIVFLYGGRWQSGKKEEYRFVADALVNRGYIVVIPDYRKYPEVKFPVFVEDSAAAIAWVTNNIVQYGGNSARIHVMGHSAGAHIGALVVADKKYLAMHHMNADTTIKSFVGLAGPYDFIPDEPDLKDMFGPPENYKNMQASNFIDGHEPPMLLLHGVNDDLVKISNLKKLQKKIIGKNGRVQTKLYDGVDHMWIIGAFSWLGYNKPNIVDDVDAFFKSVQ